MNVSQLALIRQHSDRFFTPLFRQANVEPTAMKLAETRRYVENWNDDELRSFLRDLVEAYQLPADLPERLVRELEPPAPAPLQTDAPTVMAVEEPVVRPVTRPLVPPVPNPPSTNPPIPPRPVAVTPPQLGTSSQESTSRRRIIGAGAAGVAVAVLVAAGVWWLGSGTSGAPYVAITNALLRDRPAPGAKQTGTVARTQTLSATGERAGRWVQIRLKGTGFLKLKASRAWVDSQFVMRKPDYDILNEALPEGAAGLTSQHYWALRRYATPEGRRRVEFRLESLPDEARQAGLRSYLTINFTGKAFQDPNLRRKNKHRNLLVLFTPRGESTRRLVVFEFDNAANRYGRVVYEADVEPGLALKAEPRGGFSLRDYSGNTHWLYRYEGGEVIREAANVNELLDGAEEEDD